MLLVAQRREYEGAVVALECCPDRGAAVRVDDGGRSLQHEIACWVDAATHRVRPSDVAHAMAVPLRMGPFHWPVTSTVPGRTQPSEGRACT